MGDKRQVAVIAQVAGGLLGVFGVYGAYQEYASNANQWSGYIGLSKSLPELLMTNPFVILGIVALVASMFLHGQADSSEESAEASPKAAMADKTRCPMCREEVMVGAKKCKHCGEMIG